MFYLWNPESLAPDYKQKIDTEDQNFGAFILGIHVCLFSHPEKKKKI